MIKIKVYGRRLSDGSMAWEVWIEQGDNRVDIRCRDEKDALSTARCITGLLVQGDVETFVSDVA